MIVYWLEKLGKESQPKYFYIFQLHMPVFIVLIYKMPFPYFQFLIEIIWLYYKSD